MTIRQLTALVTVMMVTFMISRVRASVVSDFSEGNDGWSVSGLNDFGPYSLKLSTYSVDYVSSGGISGGYIQAGEDPDGGTYWFEAPSKYLGDQSEYYGKPLSFGIRAEAGDWVDADIVIMSSSMVLVADLGPNPAPGAWERFSIRVDETAAWRKDSLSGPAPTRDEFLSVLSNLTGVRIRGEFRYGAEMTGLDEFSLGGYPIALGDSVAPGTINGSPVSGVGVIETPGAWDDYTFTGPVGQLVVGLHCGSGARMVRGDRKRGPCRVGSRAPSDAVEVCCGMTAALCT